MSADFPCNEADDCSKKQAFHDKEQDCSSDFLLSNLPVNYLDWIELHSSDMVVICDAEGKMLAVSRSICRFLGYQTGDLLGLPAVDFLSPPDKEMILRTFTPEIEKTRKFFVNIRNQSGKYRWMEVTASRKMSAPSLDGVYLLLMKDIQDKKEAEEMMIRSEKMSIAGQLAAGVAHEVRNPLTSIKGFLQLLQAGIDRKEEYYKIMIDEIQKIENITTELLFISKPMTDERNLESLSSMLQDVVVLLQSQARIYNVEISMDLEEDCTIYCDRTQIKQVFINLIKNAIEAMPAGGKVTVMAEKKGNECFSEVIDEGIGIPESILHKLTEPFFTTKKEGTGLGLMISSQIVEKYGGRLEIYRNPDKGSTFRVILPLGDEDINPRSFFM